MNDARFDTLNERIKSLYAIVNELEQQFPGRHFTPDGHLVGSIGEVLAASYYDLELMPASCPTYDAVSKDGKQIQIKATQVKSISLYSEPEYLIVLKILPNGETEELYNGPGRPVWQAAGKLQKNGQKSISVSKLKSLANSVLNSEKIIGVR